MKRLIIGGIAALAIGLVGAPMAHADPDYIDVDAAVRAQICHLLDTGMSGPAVYAFLQKEWASFDKTLQEVGGTPPDRRKLIKDAVAEKCPGHISKVAAL